MQSIRSWLGLFFLTISMVLTAIISPVTPIIAATGDGIHCTDWPAAGQAVSGANPSMQDIPYSTFAFSNLLLNEDAIIPSDNQTQWRMLHRPGSIFAVFYTETSASSNHILDPATGGANATPAGNYDEDNDDVPDFAERVHYCLNRAHDRYRIHFNVNEADLQWLGVSYTDPVSGAQLNGLFYPVTIRFDQNNGSVWPILWDDLTRPGSTYMNIEAGSRGAYPRDVAPWLYPALEMTVYHELAHTYQGLFKSNTDLADFMDNWIYEGTAVYIADQALLPPCSIAPLNPPRIQPDQSKTLCRRPDIYERYSERTLSFNIPDSSALFDRPWLGITRDDNHLSGGASAYSASLFWYYAQAHLQKEAQNNDVILSFWKDHQGNDDAIYNWAQMHYQGRGFSEMYHRFMVANYLQQLSYPSNGNNPYFDPWWTASGPWNIETKFHQQPNLESNDLITATLALTQELRINGDDYDRPIEQLGTRYFMVAPDSSAPVTSTLELRFQPLATRVAGPYLVTVLSLDTSSSPPTLLPETRRIKDAGDVIRLSDFGGANRRAIIVVSRAYDTANSGFTLSAHLLPADLRYRPIAIPEVFSPNPAIDDRKTTTTISYTLTTVPPPTQTLQVNLDVQRTNALGVPLVSLINEFQDPGKEYGILWNGMVGDMPLEDGDYFLQLSVQEHDNEVPRGAPHVYTNTITIDTLPPPSVTNLAFTVGSATISDTLSWDAVTDTSPGAGSYLVFKSTQLITDVERLTPFATVPLTETSYQFPHVHRSQYYAVVTEDAAGNRSTRDQAGNPVPPPVVESSINKRDVAIIIDESGSMSAGILAQGVAGAIDLVKRLETNDWLAINNIEGYAPNLPFTRLDPTSRMTAVQTLTAYSIPDGGSPIDTALAWALDQFAHPDIANNDRPDILILFSDGQWTINPAMVTALRQRGITVFVVTTPTDAVGYATMQQLVVDTQGAQPESRFFDSSDIGDSFKAITELLRGQLFEEQAESIPPGTTKDVPYLVDSRTQQATIRITWNVDEPPPRVTLTSPNGRAIDAQHLPAGVDYAEAPGEASYLIVPPALEHGTWIIHITNPDPVGPLATAQADSTGSKTPPPPKPSAPPDRSRGKQPDEPQPLDVIQPYQASQVRSADAGLGVTVEQATTSTITTTLRVADPLALELTVLDAGQPLTDTTFVIAELMDTQGLTQTFILRDDGRSQDGSAKDGRFAAPITTQLPNGLYHATVVIRHFDHQRGYVEQTREQDLFLGFPELVLDTVRWIDLSGNRDSSADPGETFNLLVDLMNVGPARAMHVASHLRSLTSGVTIGKTSAAYPDIAMNAAQTNTTPYSFTIDPSVPPGSILTFEQVVTTTEVFTYTIEVPVGVAQYGTPVSYPYTGKPIPIPDNDPKGAAASLSVPQSGLLGDMNVWVTIDHPNVEDLIVKLVQPSLINDDIVITLSQQRDNGGADFVDTVFDDEALTTIGAGTAPFTGAFRPDMRLSVLDGTDISGSWYLTVIDTRSGGSGTIIDWGIEAAPTLPLCARTGNDICVRFADAAFSVSEHVGTATITATLSTASTQPITVEYATSGSTAASGSDFTSTVGSLSFAPGETSKTFSVPIRNDSSDEPDQRFFVILRKPSAAILGDPAVATITIEDDDPPPLVQVSNALAEERAGTATVSVRLNTASAYPVRVEYQTEDGSAVAGADYMQVRGTIQFAPGDAVETITIPILEDSIGEANETILVVLANPINAALSSQQPGTVTIGTNDALTWNASNLSVHESSGAATLTVKLSAPSAEQVTVDYTTSNGTATAGSDYIATSGTLTFAPGETSKTIAVALVEDGLIEADETFTLLLSNPTHANLGAITTANLSILANDALRFASSALTLHESAGNATITVRLNAPSAQIVTVSYATEDGTAVAGSDYTATSGTLTFAPGETSTTFIVPLLDDIVGESSETIKLRLAQPVNAEIGSPATATLTISANDTVSFSSSTGSVHENAGAETVTVRLSGPSSHSVAVDYRTEDGTATAGSDYTATSGTLTFAPGETTKTLLIPVQEDVLAEVNETITLFLSNSSHAVLGTPATTTITILANDTVSFSSSSYSVHENAGSATITVKLNAPSSDVVTIAYTTEDGTATAGSDYAATSGTLTFTPGETSKTVAVAIMEEVLPEANETIKLTLSAVTNAGLGTATATLTISANDTASLGANTYRVNEGNGTVVVTVKLNAPSSSIVTAGYATNDGTATAGSDYTATSGTLTFAAGQTSKTVSIPIANDSQVEAGETFQLALSSPVNAGLGTGATTTVTIVNDD